MFPARMPTLGGKIFSNSLQSGGQFANDVIGMVARGDMRSTGSITGDLAAQSLQSYMGHTALGASAAEKVSFSQVEIGGRRWNGITNVGIKPTLHETNLTMETYILDYKGDLYGQELSVALLRFLRPESQFASVQALSQRILADIQTVRQLSGEA